MSGTYPADHFADQNALSCLPLTAYSSFGTLNTVLPLYQMEQNYFCSGSSYESVPAGDYYIRETYLLSASCAANAQMVRIMPELEQIRKKTRK